MFTLVSFYTPTPQFSGFPEESRSCGAASRRNKALKLPNVTSRQLLPVGPPRRRRGTPPRSASSLLFTSTPRRFLEAISSRYPTLPCPLSCLVSVRQTIRWRHFCGSSTRAGRPRHLGGPQIRVPAPHGVPRAICSLRSGAHIGDGSSRSCSRWELDVSRLVSDRRHFVPRRVFVTPTTLPPLEYPFHRCHELGPKWVFHWHLRRPLPARKRSLREYAVPCTLSEAAFVLVEAVLLNEPL